MIPPDVIREVGRTLHGEDFLRPLAADLGMNTRNLQRILAGTLQHKPTLGHDLLKLVDDKRARLAAALGVADGSQDQS